MKRIRWDGELITIIGGLLLVLLIIVGIINMCVRLGHAESACEAKGGTFIYGGRGGSSFCAAPGVVLK